MKVLFYFLATGAIIGLALVCFYSYGDNILNTICSQHSSLSHKEVIKEYIYLKPVEKREDKGVCPSLEHKRPPSICYGDTCPPSENKRMPGICYGATCSPSFHNP